MPNYRVTAWFFHWQFWRPYDCIGGPIRWGSYAVVEGPDGVREMTAQQVSIKQSMGLIE